MRWKWIFLAPFIFVAFVAFIALGGWAVELLWNWLLPPLFGWRAVTFWQALGLLVLCRILFGRLGPRGWRRSSFRRGPEGGWMRMTPEEREEFRQRIRERCGFGPPAGEATEKPAGGS